MEENFMKIKGGSGIFIPEYIKKKFGDEGYTKWFESLSSEAKEVFGNTIFPGKWYPHKIVCIEAAQKICDLFYGGDVKGSIELGSCSADYSLHGIYRIFVKLGSPKFIVNKGVEIMQTYMNPCKIEVAEQKDGYVVIRLTEFPEPHPMSDGRLIGWMQRAIEISGGKNVSAETTKSLAKGDSYTEFVIKWE